MIIQSQPKVKARHGVNIIMHPRDACMCSVDSHRLLRRSPLLVNAISTEPLVKITHNFVCVPLPASSQFWSHFSDFHKNVAISSFFKTL